MTSDEAFEFLELEASQELKTIQEQGAAYMNQGNLTEARQALDRAEQINAMLAFLEEIKERWKSLILPVVMVHSSEPDVRHRTSSGRLSAGQKTPQVEFYIPVLRALVEMGGSATAKNVTERVGEMMGERLNAYDRMQLPITHLIRWKDAISWLKSELAGKGYLKGNSPHGIWEITPEGRAYLERNLGGEV